MGSLFGSRKQSRRKSHRRSRLGWRPEYLEPRLVLDARLLITEIVADNTQGLEDEDSERPDWIEIYNAGDAAADLNGWHLSDNARVPAKWKFPAVTVDPEQYLVVFASGKDRINPTAPLHTNFQLSSNGEYLGLIKPDGTTVAFEYARRFPPLQPDTAYGIPQDVIGTNLVDSAGDLRVFVPTATNGGNTLGNSWTDVNFDDSTWLAGKGGIGFDQGTGFEEHIGTDIETRMFDVNPTAYVRIPFTVDNPAAFFSVVLRMKYDDGFVAYLNGAEVARRNAPPTVNWDSAATTTHRDTLAELFEDFELSDPANLLRAGKNVLAVHGLNNAVTSDDFLIAAELQGRRPAEVTAVPRYIERPTPGFPNGLVSYAGHVAPVRTSVGRGFHDQPFDVALANDTPGATLVYTTDGSAPTLENGTRVSPPNPVNGPSTTIKISKTTTLRAAAFNDDFLTSEIDTQTYFFLNDVIRQDIQATLDAGFPPLWIRTPPDYGVDPDVVGPDDKFGGEFANQIIDSLRAAPTVSIVMDMDDLFSPTGIYSNSNRTGFDWERPTSVEIIMPDGTTNVQADGGVRIAGDNVRNFANSKKQSLRLEFRERYGPTKLRFPLFGPDAADVFDTIVLRGGYNDTWVHTPVTSQYIRDQWARTTLAEMGRPQAHGQFVHVYLNGFYWGLYNAVERPNASFSASYFGGEKDEWDTLNTGNVRDGTGDAWAEMNSLARAVRNTDQTVSNAAYQKLLGKNSDGTENPEFATLLDVDNYIDYLMVNFYGGNVDWPGRNFYVGRQRGPDSTGFKFFAWDTEKILDHGEGSDLNTNRIEVADGVAAAFRSLRSNDEFRLLFADHVHRHFFNGGAFYVDPANPRWDVDHPKRNVPAARYHQLASATELPLVGESARWGDTQTSATRTDGRTFTLKEWRIQRDKNFNQYFPRRSAIVLQQFVRAGLYPALAAPVFSQHGGTITPGFVLSITAPGNVYYTLDGSDPRQSSLEPRVEQAGISPNAIQFSAPIRLNGNTVVKSRTFVDGQWSALNEATFTLAAPPLRISEVMYHPRDPEVGGQLEDDDFEYVELVNISATETIDLKGITFTQGIEFVFPQTSLAPGERIVVARNSAAFQQRYGSQIRIAGQYSGTAEEFKLSNGGELLRLEDGFGGLIQEFTYDDGWIASTDGGGHSLTIVDTAGTLDHWNNADRWRASLAVDGSPGTDDNADFNRDGQTNVADIDVFCGGYRESDSRFDLNRNGSVDRTDLIFLIEDVLGSHFGDVNLSGEFDSEDLVRVFTSGEYEDAITGNSTWAEGDWDCDGEFTSSDFVLAFTRGSFNAAAAPAEISLLQDIAAALVHPAMTREKTPRFNRVGKKNIPPTAKRVPVLTAEQVRDLLFSEQLDLSTG